jgi:hypothetical protein
MGGEKEPPKEREEKEEEKASAPAPNNQFKSPCFWDCAAHKSRYTALSLKILGQPRGSVHGTASL